MHPASPSAGAPALPRRAFVLGGGGLLGASQVGMVRALLEAGLPPDVVLGTSVGAINGSAVAADPSLRGVRRLEELWGALRGPAVFGESAMRRVATVMRTRTAVHSPQPLRDLLLSSLPTDRIDDLAVPFQCVAASIERAAEHWFTSGPLVDAVLASAAVPGLFPPVEIGGEHFMDGGLVNSIPVGRAAEVGATEVYVLHVGRVDAPLTAPRRPWEVALVSFEIARRHRFVRDLAGMPPGVAVHVLPVGAAAPPPGLSQLRYRDFTGVHRRIAAAYEASKAYLRGAVRPPGEADEAATPSPGPG